jgi:hypothetical protein
MQALSRMIGRKQRNGINFMYPFSTQSKKSKINPMIFSSTNTYLQSVDTCQRIIRFKYK